jgi:hypothetical protein
MFNNNIKAALFRYCDLGLSHLTWLKRWMRLSKSFNGFDPENFSASSLRVAVATNSKDDPLVFCPVETCMMISAYAVSPSTTTAEAQRAGDLIDAELERQAQMQGINKLLIVLPKDQPPLPEGEWKEVRVFERKIPSAVVTHGIGRSTDPHARQYLN